MSEHKRTVAVDFDGVLNDYDGWKGEDHFGNPHPSALLFLAHLHADYRVSIYTTRKPEGVRAWLEQHGMTAYVHEVTNHKPMALAYIDDRAIRFTGDFGAVLEQLSDCAPHWEKKALEPTAAPTALPGGQEGREMVRPSPEERARRSAELCGNE